MDKKIARKDWLYIVLSLFREIFFVQLHSKPKERNVILVVHDHPPSDFLWACGKALLDYLGVPKLLITRTSGVALFPTAKITGLVVDCGFREIRCVAVAEGYQIEYSFRSCSIESGVEDLNDADTYYSEDGLISTILSVLSSCNPVVRSMVAQNIVLCGGGLVSLNLDTKYSFPAIQETLLDRLKIGVKKIIRFKSIESCILNNAYVFKSVVPPQLISWIGANIVAGLDSFSMRSISLETFNNYPFIFESGDLRNAKVTHVVSLDHLRSTFDKTKLSEFPAKSKDFIKQTEQKKVLLYPSYLGELIEPINDNNEEIYDNDNDWNKDKLVLHTFQEPG